MLEAMRRGAKSWVAKGLMLLLIASFAVWGIGDVFSTRGDSTVAAVGDQTVTVDQYADALSRQRSQLSQQAGRAISFSEMRDFGLDRSILQGLIRDAAFRAELDRLGLAAPDEAVAESIRQTPAFRNAGSFSESRYRLTLSRLGYSPAEFESVTREVLGQQIISQPVSLAPTALPGAAPRIAAWRAERRGVAEATLPLSMADDPGTPDEAALEAFYAEEQERWRIPERRWGNVLHVSIEALAQDVEPTGQEIETAYEARKDSYSQPATRTIDQLPLTEGQARAQAERVRSGELAFEALAAELGEDPAELSLGTVRRDDLPEKVAEAVFAETEPGIVGPVEAPAGPVLVRIRKVQRGGTVPLEAVRGEIAAALKREEAQAEAPEIARRIEELRAQGRTLPEIAGELGLPLVPFEGIARDGTLADGSNATGLLARQGFLDEAFAALDHEEREILPTERGGYFVVLVERIEESRIPPLEDVRAEVVEAWQRAERRDALLAEAQTMAEALSGARGLEEKATELGIAVTTHEPFPRQAAPRALPPGLVETLFAADEGDAAAAPARDDSGVVLAEVTEIVEPEPERISEMAGQVRARFDRTLAEDQMTLFVEALRSNYEVTVNQDAIDAVFARIGAARDTGG